MPFPSSPSRRTRKGLSLSLSLHTDVHVLIGCIIMFIIIVVNRSMFTTTILSVSCQKRQDGTEGKEGSTLDILNTSDVDAYRPP